ncbi:MAG TPA: VWA domain-containing protein [Thermoanaerobaculia bacterium]|nr:VWA domain-containing protein [Thermoanaerobaculia bacterium]
MLLLLAALTFITPQSGSQVIGVQPIEIATGTPHVDRVEFFVDGTLAGVARKAPWQIEHDFGTLLDAHTVGAVVWSDNYKTSERAEVRTAAIAASDSYSVDLVEVPLRVRTSKPLRIDDLRLRENGVEQTLRDVRADRGAASFVFVIDRSLSMGGGKLETALHAIDDATKMLRADDSISVITFNHNVAKPREIGRGESVARTFAGLTPSGGTSMRDAVASIPQGHRTYAFVITDGGDRNSQLDDESALRRISSTKTVIDSLILGNSHVKFLDRAAKNTGGSVVDTSRDALSRSLRDLIADINSRYTVVYQSHGTQRGWRSIEITPRRGISIVNARKGYFAE